MQCLQYPRPSLKRIAHTRPCPSPTQSIRCTLHSRRNIIGTHSDICEIREICQVTANENNYASAYVKNKNGTTADVPLRNVGDHRLPNQRYKECDYNIQRNSHSYGREHHRGSKYWRRDEFMWGVKHLVGPDTQRRVEVELRHRSSKTDIETQKGLEMA